MVGPCAQTPAAFGGEAPVEGAVGDVVMESLGKGCMHHGQKRRLWAREAWVRSSALGPSLAVWWLETLPSSSVEVGFLPSRRGPKIPRAP